MDLGGWLLKGKSEHNVHVVISVQLSEEGSPSLALKHIRPDRQAQPIGEGVPDLWD